MNNLDRERVRRMWGLTEPDRPADPEVLRRRGHHETAAKWLAKWSYPLQALFAVIGFVVVLLPMLSKKWHAIIESTPVASRIFHDFSTLSGWAMVLFIALMAMLIFLDLRVNDFPGGWHPTKQWGYPSPKQVVEMTLYPRNKREEFVFWVAIVFGTAGTTIWMIFSGVLAFFIRIGG